jgi:hypothetical protein
MGEGLAAFLAQVPAEPEAGGPPGPVHDRREHGTHGGRLQDAALLAHSSGQNRARESREIRAAPAAGEDESLMAATPLGGL